MTTADLVARRLAVLAITLALVAIALSAYAISMSFGHRREVQSLGDVLHRIGVHDVPVASPPAQLDDDPR